MFYSVLLFHILYLFAHGKLSQFNEKIRYSMFSCMGSIGYMGCILHGIHLDPAGIQSTALRPLLVKKVKLTKGLNSHRVVKVKYLIKPTVWHCPQKSHHLLQLKNSWGNYTRFALLEGCLLIHEIRIISEVNQNQNHRYEFQYI